MRSRSSVVVLSAAHLMVALATVASADEGPPPELNPKTYRSPSGTYALFVNPSEQHGVGKGSYRLSRGGEVVWERDLPYTFWKAAVADDGVAAGYAYSHGFQGWGAAGDTYGDLVVAVLNADGTERARETTPRIAEGNRSCPPNRQPSPNGCFIQVDLGCFVVRTDGPGELIPRGEIWWLYPLATGTRSGELKLASPPFGENVWYFPADADGVPGTGLSLVLWARSDWKPNNAGDDGCRLSLVDAEAREVWSREWINEFNDVAYFSAWQLAEGDLTPEERFGRGRFTYLSRGAQAALTFSVTKAEDGTWRVEEAGCAPEAVGFGRSSTRLSATAPALAAAPLEPLGAVLLGSAGAEPSLRPRNFAFDQRGRCGYLQRTISGEFELRLIDPDARDPVQDAVRVTVRVGAANAESAWVGGDKWVVVAHRSRAEKGEEPPAEGWIVDAGTATVTAIEGFTCPKPSVGHRLISGGERGFAVIGDGTSNSITLYDSRGVKRWTEQVEFGAQDAAIAADGSVGVLVGIKNIIIVYDAQGRERSRVNLASVLGKKPNYVSGLDADADGGWILHDFHGDPPVYRLSGGKKMAAFEPRFADGRTFQLHGDVRRSADGRLWTSDGAALLRLTDGGVVDRVIGPSPDTDALAEIGAVTVDHTGRIYALDQRTGKAHIFDRTGKLERVLSPDPTDFSTDCGNGSITVAGDGSMYWRPSSIGEDVRYLTFDGSGKRRGFEAQKSHEVCDEWFFRPGGQELVVLGYERAFLYDSKGDLVRRVERRADGLWLVHPSDAAVAPNGSFAILADSGLGSDTEESVTIFSAAGEPLKTHEIPNADTWCRVAASNRTVAVLNGDELLLIDRETDRTTTHALPGIEDSPSWHVPFFSPDGAEIWVIAYLTREVYRYRTPAAPQ